MNTVQRFKQRKILKALLGILLKKGWNWLSNVALVGAIAESPAVMTASGWRIDKNSLVKQDLQNNKEVKLLRGNLATIGEATVTAPTVVSEFLFDSRLPNYNYTGQRVKAVEQGNLYLSKDIAFLLTMKLVSVTK